MRTERLLLLLTLSAAGALGAAQPPSSKPLAVLFEGARLIAGDGRVIERSAFLVDNGRFTKVAKAGEIDAVAHSDRVDLTGKTVMPALVDAHTHLGYRTGATFAAANFTRDVVLDELSRL